MLNESFLCRRLREEKEGNKFSYSLKSIIKATKTNCINKIDEFSGAEIDGGARKSGNLAAKPGSHRRTRR